MKKSEALCRKVNSRISSVDSLTVCKFIYPHVRPARVALKLPYIGFGEPVSTNVEEDDYGEPPH